MLYEQKHEAAVFIDGLARLRYKNIIPDSVRLYGGSDRSHTALQENKDFTVHSADGALLSLPDSVIADYSGSSFYGIHGFDHTLVATFGNYAFTYYADYLYDSNDQSTDEQMAYVLSCGYPKISSEKDHIRYIVFGDSISTGAEASTGEYAYFNVFAKSMEEILKVRVEVINKAIGGETSDDGMNRFHDEVLGLKPDMVSIAYGMNDQNKHPDSVTGHFVEPLRYKENIRSMSQALQSAGAQVILVSPCLPNPEWMYTSGDTDVYADRLREISRELAIPLADVSSLWTKVLESGKPPQSLLLNDINHPNDYGHKLYAVSLTALIRR